MPQIDVKKLAAMRAAKRDVTAQKDFQATGENQYPKFGSLTGNRGTPRQGNQSAMANNRVRMQMQNAKRPGPAAPNGNTGIVPPPSADPRLKEMKNKQLQRRESDPADNKLAKFGDFGNKGKPMQTNPTKIAAAKRYFSNKRTRQQMKALRHPNK